MAFVFTIGTKKRQRGGDGRLNFHYNKIRISDKFPRKFLRNLRAIFQMHFTVNFKENCGL